MWSIRIALGGAVLVAVTASASAQTARTDPHAGPLPLIVINQGPIVEPSPVVGDDPAQRTSAKPKKSIAATPSRPVSPGSATRPQAAATRSRTVPQGNGAVTQGTAGPAAFAAPDPMLAPLPGLGLPADPLERPAHLVVPSPVPTMVAAPDAPTRKSQGGNTPWLLLGTLGGGVVGAAIVWFLVSLRKGRARLTRRREEEADQPARHHVASAYDNGRDVRVPEYDERRDDAREWAETNPPWRDNRASAYDRRQDDGETDPRWAAPAYDAVRDALGERQQAGRPRSRSVAPTYDTVRDSLGETLEADQPSTGNAVSAYDGFFDALRDGEEGDQPSGGIAASADDAVRDARLRSAPPTAPKLLDQRGTTPPGAAKTRRRNADKVLYDSLEQEITSLLGRPVGKKSQKEEVDQPGGHNAASAYSAVRDALGESKEADQPSSHDAAFADDAVGDARPRSATPAESNPLDQLDTTPPGAAERRQPNAGKTLYDSLEQTLARLLGRSTGKNSQREEADHPSGRKAATAFDAVRDALGKSEEAVQPGGRKAASVYDGIRDALTKSEEADQPSGGNAASAYDAVRDALSESEEADQPSERNAASAYDAVRDALTERNARPRSATPAESKPGTTPPRVAERREPNAGKTLHDSFERSMASLLGRSTGNSSQSEEANRPGGRNAASAYDGVRDALTERDEVDQPSGHNAASAHDAGRDALTEQEEADELLAAMRMV